MAAPVLKNVRMCARALAKCEHVAIRSRPKTTKSPFLHYLKIVDPAPTEKTPDELKSYKERVAGSFSYKTCGWSEKINFQTFQHFSAICSESSETKVIN